MSGTANSEAEAPADANQVDASPKIDSMALTSVPFTQADRDANTALINFRSAETPSDRSIYGNVSFVSDTGEDPFHAPDAMRPREGGVFNEGIGKWEYPEEPQPEIDDPPGETAEQRNFDTLKKAFQQISPERQAEAMKEFGPHFEKTIQDSDDKLTESLDELQSVLTRPDFLDAMRDMRRVGGELEASINLMGQDKISDFGKSFVQSLAGLTGEAKENALVELKQKLDNTNDPKLKAFLEQTIGLMENPPDDQHERDKRAQEIGGMLDHSATRELLQSMRDNPEMEGAAKIAMNQYGLNGLSAKFHNFRDTEDRHGSVIDEGKEAWRNYRHAYLNSMNLRGQYAEVLAPIESQEFRDKSMQIMEEANQMAENWFGSGNVWGNPRYESFLWKRPVAEPLNLPGTDI